jgi:orotate phosphoribosyltransferase
MDMRNLAGQIDSVSRLRGQFRLRSGAVSGEYFDKYRFESDPKLLAAIAEGLAGMIPSGIEALAGLELGGVPITSAGRRQLDLPVRRRAEDACEGAGQRASNRGTRGLESRSATISVTPRSYREPLEQRIR